MHWFFIALAAPFFWALVNISDSYLVERFSQKEIERSSGALALFAGLGGLFIAIVIAIFASNLFSISILDAVLLIICGFITIVWLLLYLFSLEKAEASSVVPWFVTIPIFGYILGYLLLGENLSSKQFIGSGIIFIGLIIISIDWTGVKKSFKKEVALYMLIASFLSSVSGIIFKYVTVGGNFWVSSFWEYAGLALAGFIIYACVPHYRNSFHAMQKTGGYKILILNIVNELLSIAGNMLTSWALLLAPVAMVYLINGFQPALVLILATAGTKLLPNIVKENLSMRSLVPKIVGLVIIIAGSIFLFTV